MTCNSLLANLRPVTDIYLLFAIVIFAGDWSSHTLGGALPTTFYGVMTAKTMHYDTYA